MVNINQRHPLESIGGVILVLLFHIFGIWGLLLLMHSNKPEKIPAPLEVKIVQVSSAASAAAAQAAQQPPAPEMIVPPPPEIEPPPINTEAPIQPKPPTVVKKKVQKKQPAAKPSQSASSKEQTQSQSQYNGSKGEGMSNTPGQGQPDRSAGSRPLNGVKLVYPEDMEAAGKEGRVILSCDVEPDGHTSNCHVVSSSGGSSFREEALHYVNSARYQPATRNGVPVKETGHRYTISFKLGD